MKITNYKHILALGTGFALTGILYFWFINSSLFPEFTAWAALHKTGLFLSLVAIKIAGIVWPPLPGGILTFGSIPILGWQNAYLADLLGSIVGSTIAYFIAKSWGISFMSRIFDAGSLDKLRKIRVPRGREFEAIFIFRFFGATIVELVCYAAGLLRVRYSVFMLATIASHAAIGIPFYYFGKGLFGENGWVGPALFIGLIIVFLTLRKRYFVEEADII